MDIEGTYTLEVPPEDVWESLMNQQVLSRTIPGVERIERVDPHAYAFAMHIKYAPLIGTYHGFVKIVDQQYPYHYRILVEGDVERQSTISGDAVMHLSKRDNHTIVAYKGWLQLGRFGSRLPSSIIKGTAKLLIQEFFNSLAEQLHALHTETEAQEELYASSTIIIPPPTNAAERVPFSTFLHRIVHWLRLGSGNPAQEMRWVTHLQRIGIVSGLLFLVWVGTRLPRR